METNTIGALAAQPNAHKTDVDWKDTARAAAEEHGWRVFPIRITLEVGKARKRPLTARGHKDATTNVDDIDWTGANGFGIATGDGVFAFDLDDYKAGSEAHTWLQEKGLDVPTRTHRTISGGQHWIFALPDQWRNLESGQAIVPGLDTRGNGGWIAFGEGYTVLDDRAPALLPDAICEALHARWAAKSGGLPAGELETWTEPEGAHETLRELLGESSALTRRWNGDADGLNDTSRSAFDFAVARLLNTLGCTYDFIVWALFTQFEHGTRDERQCMRAALRTAQPRPEDVFPALDAEDAASIARHSASTSKPAGLPKPVGAVLLLMDYIAGLSRREGYDHHALAALVAIAGASEGLFVVDRPAGPTTLNLQGVLVAGTGVGKETDRTVIQQTLDNTKTYYADHFASSEGLHRQLTATRSVALMNDEYGRMLETINGGGGNVWQKEIVTLVVRLYGLGLGTLTAKQNKKMEDTLPPVQAPFLTAFHTTTPDVMQAFSSRDVKNGVLNRPVFVRGPNYAPLKPRGYVAPRDMPQELAASLEWLRRFKQFIAEDYEAMWMQGGIAIGGEMPEPSFKPVVRAYQKLSRATPIEPDAHAEDALYEWQDEVEAHLKAGGPTSELWGRAMENTLKVAGIYALGDLMAQKPSKFSGVVPMTRAHVEWAVAFMRESIETQIDLVANNIADTPVQQRKLLVLRVLRHKGMAMSKGEITRATQQLTKRERDDALDELVSSGIVKFTEESTKGRARGVYTLVAG